MGPRELEIDRRPMIINLYKYEDRSMEKRLKEFGGIDSQGANLA